MLNSNLCAVCGYSITEPVCKGCYTKQTLILLDDFKVNSANSKFINCKLKNMLHLDTLNDTECILCKKDNVSICGYCFSRIIMRILREMNFSEDIIGNFEYASMYEKAFLENENLLDMRMDR